MRSYRIASWEKRTEKLSRVGHDKECNDSLSPNYYWSDEAPTFNKEILETIVKENVIDTVVTHCPIVLRTTKQKRT